MILGKRPIIVAVILAVVIAVTVTIVNITKSDEHDITVTVKSSPEIVSVSLNGEDYGEVSNGESLVVHTGEKLSVEISRDEFETYAEELDVNSKHVTVQALLRPETEAAQAILDEEEELQYEAETSEKYIQDAERAYKEHPILRDMPKHGEAFEAYQGVPQAPEQPFAVYLYLYEGSEEQGRAAFNAWMKEEGYNQQGYAVVEQVRREAAPPTEYPSANDIDRLQPAEIELPDSISGEGKSPEEVAKLFVKASMTWDAAVDTHHTDGLRRAAPLMSDEQAAAVQTPTRPTLTPTWRRAIEQKARSYAWVADYEGKDDAGDLSVTMQACWAWISEDNPPVFDGPRTYQLTISKGEQPRVVNYTYSDPDPFVDNSETTCDPSNS